MEEKISSNEQLQTVISKYPTNFPIHFKKIGYNWISFGDFIPPAYDKHGLAIDQNEFGTIFTNSREEQNIALLFLNGKIAFAYWIITGDDFHLTKGNIAAIPFDLSRISSSSQSELLKLATSFLEVEKEAIVFMTMHGKRLGNFDASRFSEITEKSDMIFLRELGLESVWDEVELLKSQLVRTAQDTSDGNGDEE